MNVSIIIPWYNAESLVMKNLPKVLSAFKNLGNKVHEVIVVDDASSDKSNALIRNNFPEIKLIRHKVKRGLIATINTGVRSAKGELVCLLGSDSAPENDFLKDVFSHFKNPRTFAVSLNGGGVFGWDRGYFKNGFIVRESGQKSAKAHSTFWVSSAGGVFRRKTWMLLGGMDEKLFSPFCLEDLDISYRAMKQGFVLVWDPKVKIVSKQEKVAGQYSKNQIQRIGERNELIFMWKNITSRRLFGRHLAGLLKRVLRRPGYGLIIIMSLMKIGGIAKARVKEIKVSKVSDEAVLARFS